MAELLVVTVCALLIVGVFLWDEWKTRREERRTRAALVGLVDGVDWEMVLMGDQVPERREKHMALLDQADDALGRPQEGRWVDDDA